MTADGRERRACGLLLTVGEAARRGAAYRRATLAFGLAACLAAPRSTQQAAAFNGLGVTHKDRGRYERARTCYGAASTLLSEMTDPPVWLMATLEHNWAGLAHARGDFGAGLPHAHHAVALRSSLTPIDPIAVAADEAVLAACLAGSGERDAARALFDKVLRTVEEGYGPDHYEVAVAVHNLAALDPNPSEAEKGYLRALTIKMRRLGVRHPEVGALWANLGALYASCGRTGDAEAAYARALPIVTRGWGNEHPATVALRANMARFS